MRQFDLGKSIEDSFDLMHCLTHPNMDDWNYFPSFLAEISRVEQLMLDSCGMIPVGYWAPPQTATEAVMLGEPKTVPYANLPGVWDDPTVILEWLKSHGYYKNAQ